MKPSFGSIKKVWNRLKAKGFEGTSLSVVGKCMIKIFRGRGAGVVTPSKPPPSTNNFSRYPRPILRCLWKDPFHPTSSIFHCYPLPIHHPFPLKNFNHTLSTTPAPSGFNGCSIAEKCCHVTKLKNWPL